MGCNEAGIKRIGSGLFVCLRPGVCDDRIKFMELLVVPNAVPPLVDWAKTPVVFPFSPSWVGVEPPPETLKFIATLDAMLSKWNNSICVSWDVLFAALVPEHRHDRVIHHTLNAQGSPVRHDWHFIWKQQKRGYLVGCDRRGVYFTNRVATRALAYSAFAQIMEACLNEDGIFKLERRSPVATRRNGRAIFRYIRKRR